MATGYAVQWGGQESMKEDGNALTREWGRIQLRYLTLYSYTYRSNFA